MKSNSLSAWKFALSRVLHEGHDTIDNFDGRVFREMQNLIVHVDDFSDITAPIDIISNFQKWVYPRVDEIATVTLGRKNSPAYLYTYGQRVFNYEDKMNQINEFIIPLLKENPSTRRAIVNIWEPLIDSNKYNKEVPSMLILDYKIRKEALHLTVVMRSCDILFGFPSNIYQGFLLLEYVAQKLDLKPGRLTVVSLSAHVFEEQFDDVNSILKK